MPRFISRKRLVGTGSPHGGDRRFCVDREQRQHGGFTCRIVLTRPQWSRVASEREYQCRSVEERNGMAMTLNNGGDDIRLFDAAHMERERFYMAAQWKAW